MTLQKKIGKLKLTRQSETTYPTRNLKVVRIFRPGTSGSLDVLITTTTTAPGL